jgi:L-fucose mutarotase
VQWPAPFPEADAFFPGESMSSRVIRADGIRVTALLDGILALMDLDAYADSPVVMMQPASGDALDPETERSYRILKKGVVPA